MAHLLVHPALRLLYLVHLLLHLLQFLNHPDKLSLAHRVLL